MTILNAFTVDVEEWFHICGVDKEEIKFENWDKLESRVTGNTLKLMEILRENNVKATFFFLGWIAERYPELVLKVKKEGHEIATHGYAHKLIYKQSPEEFTKDLEKSIDVIEGIAKEKVIGYRGAGFSIKKESLWALKIIAERGLKYDTTIFPAKRGHGGLQTFRLYPHLINFENDLKLWEFPISVVNILGKNIPFSGGGYLRLFPYWFIKQAIQRINRKGQAVMIYIHPREIDVEQPRIKLPLYRKFKYYVNLKTTESKIRALLSDFKFTSIKEILSL